MLMLTLRFLCAPVDWRLRLTLGERTNRCQPTHLTRLNVIQDRTHTCLCTWQVRFDYVRPVTHHTRAQCRWWCRCFPCMHIQCWNGWRACTSPNIYIIQELESLCFSRMAGQTCMLGLDTTVAHDSVYQTDDNLYECMSAFVLSVALDDPRTSCMLNLDALLTKPSNMIALLTSASGVGSCLLVFSSIVMIWRFCSVIHSISPVLGDCFRAFLQEQLVAALEFSSSCFGHVYCVDSFSLTLPSNSV